MSTISDAMNNARQKINNVYNALEAKGATMPEVRNLDHMVNTVEGLSQISSLTNWTYSGSNGTLNLESYTGDFSQLINLPYMDGLYVNKVPNSSSWLDYYNVPFYRNNNVISVNLNNVPFKDNSMKDAFWNCFNLTSVENINSNVTNMYEAFGNCSSLNYNIQL